MDVPRNCLYSRDHFWVRLEGNFAVAGVTDYLQGELGPVTLVDLPEVGDEVQAMTTFGIIESSHTVADLTSPLSGEVARVNLDLLESPDSINEDPYGDGWLIRILLADHDQVAGLMTPEDYEDYISDLGEGEP